MPVPGLLLEDTFAAQDYWELGVRGTLKLIEIMTDAKVWGTPWSVKDASANDG